MTRPMRTELRQRYRCGSCGAPAGQYCRTFSEGKVTQPHSSRWTQYYADPTISRESVSTQTIMITVAQLTDALLPEGWGDGFSKSLAERVMCRLKDPTFYNSVADDPGHTHLGSSGAV